jgi:hypothetical protein
VVLGVGVAAGAGGVGGQRAVVVGAEGGGGGGRVWWGGWWSWGSGSEVGAFAAAEEAAEGVKADGAAVFAGPFVEGTGLSWVGLFRMGAA